MDKGRTSNIQNPRPRESGSANRSSRLLGSFQNLNHLVRETTLNLPTFRTRGMVSSRPEARLCHDVCFKPRFALLASESHNDVVHMLMIHSAAGLKLPRYGVL